MLRCDNPNCCICGDEVMKEMQKSINHFENEGGLIPDEKPKVDRKDVRGKPNPLLMPYEALVAYSKVSDCGNSKYGNRTSWMNASDGVSTYANACARHIFKAQFEDVDQESGLPHYMHALWCMCAVVWHYERNEESKAVR